MRTSLWLSELTHAWHQFDSRGYTQTLISPLGGKVPLEPRSLTYFNLDATAKSWMRDEKKMKLLENTKTPADINPDEVHAIYLTGGHAVMYDFIDSAALHKLIVDLWTRGKVVSAACHGYCGLLNVQLADRTFLIMCGGQMRPHPQPQNQISGLLRQNRRQSNHGLQLRVP